MSEVCARSAMVYVGFGTEAVWGSRIAFHSLRLVVIMGNLFRESTNQRTIPDVLIHSCGLDEKHVGDGLSSVYALTFLFCRL